MYSLLSRKMLIVKLRSYKLSASLLRFQAFALPVTIFKTEALEIETISKRMEPKECFVFISSHISINLIF